MKAFRRSTEASSYHRYLKPGALAQLRDSRISARSHKLSDSLSQLSVSRLIRSPVQTQLPAAAVLDRVPPFVTYSFGPRYLKRKKLVAARSVNLPSIEISSSDSLMSLLGGDAVAAH
ncbi:uncharacterized protein LOC116213036 [Punica granatum]|uniref:Uncharacterized protein n=2 Tax=Punica granatum TaxID=22663 RepID=A0A218XVF2_PUNGR|nr:uncharacterized protein LOC116213036 [Punica granatum]OWM88768.1 hypothetical protein CDL15_Pgr002535 [Punica granatum]PKI55840.1 hypothetical protein CRG98_023721 [Punica granatum]